MTANTHQAGTHTTPRTDMPRTANAAAPSTRIAAHADSLIELLISQCADLEALLRLARRETEAAEGQDFDNLLAIVAERATLGGRLEVYQRQLAELSALLGAAGEGMLKRCPAAHDAARLATEIQAEDRRNRALLLATRADLTAQGSTLNTSRRATNAYLSAAQGSPVACDRVV